MHGETQFNGEVEKPDQKKSNEWELYSMKENDER